MRRIHIICRPTNNGVPGLQGLSKTKDAENTYKSEAWDLDIDEASNLIGGYIYLHPAKSDKSLFGGCVTSVYQVDTDHAHSTRVGFVFEAKADARGVKWEGATHAMAWNSGILK